MEENVTTVTPPGSVPPEMTSTELSMRRTGLSFQRTRMSADRTLMSVQRTALSLISFGFTIFNFFRGLKGIQGAERVINENAPRNFGLTLTLLGILLLALGIWQNAAFMRYLRAERDALIKQGLIHGDSPYPFSLAQVGAIFVLLLGLFSFLSIVARMGPFG